VFVLVKTLRKPRGSQVVMPPSYVLIHSEPSRSTISLGTPHFSENSGVFAELKLTKRVPSKRSTLPNSVPIHNYPSGVCATPVTEPSVSPSSAPHTLTM
jgi:hypothetical protein